jgi:hypothetical protein
MRIQGRDPQHGVGKLDFIQFGRRCHEIWQLGTVRSGPCHSATFPWNEAFPKCAAIGRRRSILVLARETFSSIVSGYAGTAQDVESRDDVVPTVVCALQGNSNFGGGAASSDTYTVSSRSVCLVRARNGSMHKTLVEMGLPSEVYSAYQWSRELFRCMRASAKCTVLKIPPS